MSENSEPVFAFEIWDVFEVGVGGEDGDVVGEGYRGDLEVDVGDGTVDAAEVGFNLAEGFGGGVVEGKVVKFAEKILEACRVLGNAGTFVHHEQSSPMEGRQRRKSSSGWLASLSARVILPQ